MSTSNAAKCSNSKGFATPSPTKRERLRVSPSSSNKPPIAPKRIYLIRHGHSLGQAAGHERRQSDPTLRDCGLTERGIQQATQLPSLLGNSVYQSIQLVVSSPMTRALHTAILAFPDKPILIHYNLREFGSKIPENTPRPISTVLKELQVDAPSLMLDVETLKPDDWPRRHDTPPKVVRRDNIRSIFQDWLASRPERVIAVVAHYHVIRAALWDPYSHQSPDVYPANASPIGCELDASRVLRLSMPRSMPSNRDDRMDVDDVEMRVS